jgi:hypothetical protein
MAPCKKQALASAPFPASPEEVVSPSTAEASPAGAAAGANPAGAAAEDTSADAEDTSAEDQNVVCTKCGDQVKKENASWVNRALCMKKSSCRETWKCKGCNLQGVVLHRVFKRDQTLQVQYNNLSAAEKKSWMEAHRDEHGDFTQGLVHKSLTQFVTTPTTKTSKSSAEKTFLTDHEWMDDGELQARFANDTEAYENTKAFGKQFTCPTTKRTLYGVPEYKSKGRESSTSTFEQETAMSSNTTLPEPKKPRTQLQN